MVDLDMSTVTISPSCIDCSSKRYEREDNMGSSYLYCKRIRSKRMRSLLPRVIFIVSILGIASMVAQIKHTGFTFLGKKHGGSELHSAEGHPIVLRRLLESSVNEFAVLEEESPTESVEDSSNTTGMHYEPRNCTQPSIHEFPKDPFTNVQRLQGALVIHFFVCFYMFVALAIICDDYFVPSLEQISEKLKLTEDVAGATFMAAGSSAPELFTSIIGVFVARGDVGVGTIVGSAVFNILVIIGLCALLCTEDVPLHWWPLMRDSSYYGLAIAVLIAVIHDSYVSWYESLMMLLLYVGYIIIMKFNSQLEKFIKAAREKTVRRLQGRKNTSNNKEKEIDTKDDTSLNSDKKDVESQLMGEKTLESTEMKKNDEKTKKAKTGNLSNNTENLMNSNGSAGDGEADNDMLLKKAPNGNSSMSPSNSTSPADKKPMCVSQNGMSVVAQVAPRPQTLLPIDEVISGGNRPLRFEEAGLRLMMSNSFAPKTRLRMACKILINERQNLVVEKSKDDGAPQRVLLRRKTDLSLDGLSSTPAISERAMSDTVEDVKSISAADQDGDEDLSSYTHPFVVPRDSCIRFVKWFFCWPISFVFFITIPNCSKKRWEKWYMVSFFMSMGWITACSYTMVWMGTICGYTLHIPDSIMGITFLAAGTSVPDTIASVIVARQGLGDMAVSNSIGSNVFDILLGLAFPWFLKTAVVSSGTVVKINSRGLLWSVFLLLASLFFVIISIHVNGWKLTKKLGVLIMSMYAIFLTLSILIEFNIFFPVNLPMCYD